MSLGASSTSQRDDSTAFGAQLEGMENLSLYATRALLVNQGSSGTDLICGIYYLEMISMSTVVGA